MSFPLVVASASADLSPVAYASAISSADLAASPASFAALRAWCQTLRTPGAWSDDAWRAVAPALVRLPGWPGGTLLVKDGAEVEFHFGAPNGGFVVVSREARGDGWCVPSKEAPEGDAAPARATVFKSGDDFFHAVLEALDRQGTNVLGRQGADGLRLAVAALLIQLVDDLREGASTPPWLTLLLGRPPHALAGTSVARRVSPPAPHPTPGLASTTTSRMVSRPGRPPVGNRAETRLSREALGALSSRVSRALARKEFALACKLLEAVQPASAVPLSLVREICERVGREGDGHLTLQMIQRLSARPGLFHPEVGLHEKSLDLHSSSVFASFPEGHYNRAESLRAVLPELAALIFEMHARRGAVGPGVLVVVGWHGTGKLAATIVDCIQAFGWEALTPTQGAHGRERKGTLMIGAAGSALDADARVMPVNRNDASRLLEEALERMEKRRDSSVGPLAEKQAEFALEFARQALPIQDVLSILRHYDVPMCMYEELGRWAMVKGDWDGWRTMLGAIEERWGSLLPSTWQGFMIGGRLHTIEGWKVALRVFDTMVGYRQPEAADLCVLYRAPLRRSEVEEAVLHHDDLVARGMAPSAEVAEVLLRRCAYARWGPGFRRFEKLALANGRPETNSVMQSRLLHVLRTESVVGALIRLRTLRALHQSLDREMLRVLISALRDEGRMGDACDVMDESLLCDDVYRPALGLEKTPGGASLLDLSASGVYKHPMVVWSVRERPWAVEVLVALAWHRRRGHLQPGMRLLLSGGSGGSTWRYAREQLREWGLDLVNARAENGALRSQGEIIGYQPTNQPTKPGVATNDSPG